MLIAALVGFAMGFAGSIPLAGPTAILVATFGLRGRIRAGALVALGSALPESTYAGLALWGFGELLARYAWIETVSRVVGVVIVAAIGLVLVLRRPPTHAEAAMPEAADVTNDARSFVLGATMTGLNPTLIVNWAAAITLVYSLGLLTPSRALAVPFAFGTVFGILAWYGIFLELLRQHRGRFRAETRERVLRSTGAVLLVAALVMGWRLIV